MKKPGLALKVAVVVNALLLVVGFVGCPARKDRTFIGPTIATPPPHFERLLTPDGTVQTSPQDPKKEGPIPPVNGGPP
jgi:hypothetical protein